MVCIEEINYCRGCKYALYIDDKLIGIGDMNAVNLYLYLLTIGQCKHNK